jgi:hypothetical protein
MIDILAEGLANQMQQRLSSLFPLVRAILSACVGLGAWATVLALFSPASTTGWILAAVFVSAASAGYTLAEHRATGVRIFFWSLALVCALTTAGIAWKILAYVQAHTHLAVISPGLILGLFACSVAGTSTGTWLRLRYERCLG